MNDNKIPAALTPEEWAVHASTDGYVSKGRLWLSTCNDGQVFNRHGLAALCLSNKLYGFSEDDLVLLKDAAAMYRSMYGKTIEDAFLIEDLAERIKALLPPVEKSVI